MTMDQKVDYLCEFGHIHYLALVSMETHRGLRFQSLRSFRGLEEVRVFAHIFRQGVWPQLWEGWQPGRASIALEEVAPA